MRDFKTLGVWKKAHQLTLAIYRATRDFPPEERFGQTSQTRRAASSIAANICEGCGRRTSADFARFLSLALGSASELEYHLILNTDLGYLTSAEHAPLEEQTIEVKRMLSGLIKTLIADS